MKKIILKCGIATFIFSLVISILLFLSINIINPFKLYLNPIVPLVHTLLLPMLALFPPSLETEENAWITIYAIIILGWTISGFIGGFIYYKFIQRIKIQSQHQYIKALNIWGKKYNSNYPKVKA